MARRMVHFAKTTKQAAAFSLGLLLSWLLVKLLTYELDAELELERMRNEARTVQIVKEDTDVISKEVHVDLANPVVKKIVESHRRAFAAGPSMPSVHLITLVKSYPAGRTGRDTLRTSWFIRDSHTKRPVPNRLIYQFFLVGEANEKTNKLLEAENAEYDDIIRVPYPEEFSYLAAKVLYGLQQVFTNHVFDYVLVANEDVLVNWQTFLPWLATSPTDSLYAGSLVERYKVSRDKAATFYLPKELYPQNEYPPMANGYAYVMSSDLVSRLLSTAHEQHLLGADDAMVGIIMQRLGVPVKHVAEFKQAVSCAIKFPMVLAGLSHAAIREKHNQGLQRVAMC